MCEFCVRHGEGKIWYLNMRNYGQELLSLNGRREQITSFFRDFESRLAKSLSMLDAIQALPFIPDIVGHVATIRQKQSHFGQVIPLEDVDKILDMTDFIVRLPCVCRSLTTGRCETRYCYGLGIDPADLISQYPDYGDNLDYLDKEAARTAIHKLDQEGLVHSIWTFDTPFIGGMCNCDQDCIAYRVQVGTGMMQVFFPAEYIASIEWDLCSGCKLCRGQCPFGAIRYSASQNKCMIAPSICYGCGVCRAACNRNAILLKPRQKANIWRRNKTALAGYKITINLCNNPRDCRTCIDVCPSQVFMMKPDQNRTDGTYASDWRVEAILPSRCTGCGECQVSCPEGAITVIS